MSCKSPPARGNFKRADIKPNDGLLAHNTAVKAQILKAGGIEVNLSECSVRSLGRVVRLPPCEYRMLLLLMSEPGKIASRERLAEELWSAGEIRDLRTVDQRITRLRRALNRGRAPDPICSVRGKGYKFSEAYDREYAVWLGGGRKKLSLDEIVHMRKRVKRSDDPRCPRCDGQRTIRGGQRMKRSESIQAWRCKDCGRTFSLTE